MTHNQFLDKLEKKHGAKYVKPERKILYDWLYDHFNEKELDIIEKEIFHKKGNPPTLAQIDAARKRIARRL